MIRYYCGNWYSILICVTVDLICSNTLLWTDVSNLYRHIAFNQKLPMIYFSLMLDYCSLRTEGRYSSAEIVEIRLKCLFLKIEAISYIFL